MSALRPEFLFFVLSCLISVSLVSAVYNRTETLPGCPSKCGNLDIPYPFGVGENCSISIWTKIKCNTTFNPPKPFIGQIEVVHLSLTELRIKSDIATACYDQSGSQIQVPDAAWFTLRGSPFTFSSTKNKLFAIGCDTFLTALQFDDTALTCRTSCDTANSVAEGSCSGIGCCQAPIPKKLNYIYATVGTFNNYTFVNSFDTCGSAFMAEEANYTFKTSDFTNPSSLPVLPIVVNIAVDNKTCQAAKQNATAYACKENSYCHESVDGTGYLCSCNKGFEGNPYIKQSCQDVNECEDPNNNPCKGICTNTYGSYECSCPDDFYGDGTKNGSGCTRKNKKFPVLQVSLGLGFGFLFLLIGGLWSFFTIKKRNIFKQKEKFFHQNGGLLLQQQITTKEGGVESVKIFTSDELKLATNNYDSDRILGRGGSGTVYKGILPDLRIVAIKKSRLINENQLKEFINEVVILTQINHRNVVKLLGCCLDAEVPMLVYEFVSNGTLLYHLHKKDGTISSLTWQDRLRIASETATALAYLHTAASIPIFHRDVKSANILLDDNFTAKVADFGASRLNPTDETQISTLIQGTMGYLDPSYYNTGQLTAKSDVYSFGVVLVELLTGEKPVSFERSQEQRDLATYFTMSLKENGVIELLDATIVNEGYTEEALEVAELANKCLYVNGEERPTMKEVSMKLEGLRGFQKHQPVRQGGERTESPRFHEDKDLYSIPSTGDYSTNGTSAEYSSDMELRQSMNAPR
ncbi:hypothetical protein ACHQM5_002293 [Ranunculus cassubicifolius]